MDLLTDEKVEMEWIQALRDDGHDVVRVVDIDELGPSATDPDVLAVTTQLNRVLLTADQSDFAEPPMDDHAGAVIEGTRRNPTALAVGWSRQLGTDPRLTVRLDIPQRI